MIKTIGSFLYKAWMAFARGLAVVNTTIILTLVYLLLIGPTWLVMQFRRKDLLDRKLGSASTLWKQKDPIKHTIEQSRRQF